MDTILAVGSIVTCWRHSNVGIDGFFCHSHHILDMIQRLSVKLEGSADNTSILGIQRSDVSVNEALSSEIHVRNGAVAHVTLVVLFDGVIKLHFQAQQVLTIVCNATLVSFPGWGVCG